MILFGGFAVSFTVMLAIYDTVHCCSASHNLKEYAAKERQERIQDNGVTTIQTANKTDGLESNKDGTTSKVFQPSEITSTKIISQEKTRKRRRVGVPFLVVQHSLTIGNFTLVKTPMMENFDAQKYCQRDGGHLALVKTQKDIEILRTLLALFSHEHDHYIFEAYVNIMKSVPRQQQNVYDYHGYDAMMEGSLESAEQYREDACTTLRKEGVFNKVDCSWSLAFFCETAVPPARPH